MAVHSVTEIPGQEWKVDNKGVRTTTRKFLVTTDLADPENLAIAAIPVLRYSHHPTDYGILALGATATRPDDTTLGVFIVTVDYTSDPFGKGQQGSDPSQSDQSVTPTARPWVITYGSVHVDKVLGPQDRSATPKDVVNSSRQAFEPPIMTPHSHLLITIKAYKDPATYNPASLQSLYQGTINQSGWQGYDPETLRCNELGATSIFDQGQYYWEVNLVIEYNPQRWNPIKVLDQGCVALPSLAPGTQPEPILDKKGNPITTPVPLDGNGQRLAAGADLVYLSFNAYDETDWTNIL